LRRHFFESKARQTVKLTLQQQQTTTTNQGEERTVMSNLSPDDSAKTMMTNVSRMVETLGTVVNTLAKENANMAKETANTNDTIKQMMIQQTATMNNFMMLMTRNEERRQEVPIRVIQQTSTPTNSTITNSQFSLSQQSTSVNKRKIDGIADDETTAASTLVIGTIQSTEEDDIDAMLEEQSEALEEIRAEQGEEMDVTMTDNEQTTTNKQQQQKQTTNTGKVTTALAAGDFEQQFNMKRQDKTGSSAPITGANRQ
jgi:cell shape-determining protein MreC